MFDFEPVALKAMPIAHWGHLLTGSDDDGTIRANREGFLAILRKEREGAMKQNGTTSVASITRDRVIAR